MVRKEEAEQIAKAVAEAVAETEEKARETAREETMALWQAWNERSGLRPRGGTRPLMSHHQQLSALNPG